MKCNESEESIKNELRRCEVEAMDEIVKELEDAAILYNSKILYWYVNKLRERSQSGLVPVKDSNGPQLVIMKEQNIDG